MKDIYATPSWRAGPVRLADHIELCALRSPRRRFSAGDMIANLDRREDEEEENFERPVSEAFQELAERIEHLGSARGLYPFELRGGDELRARREARRPDGGCLYLFLLLATTLNMRDQRWHAELDGAELFERLSAEVARRYLGGPDDPRVGALVFGTSRAGDVHSDESPTGSTRFEAAVNDLCQRLGEGGHFRPRTDRSVRARDDKLDVVVWRGFSDRRGAKLVGFGQCKTGTAWGPELPRLNPDAFCRRWFDAPPAVTPVKLFFLTDRVREDFIHHGIEAGVLFDRCRVLDYADRLPRELVSKCALWARTAATTVGLSL
ncbi:MAG: hypothetical protein H7A45_19690 [Verrucomicrobiales bacterium]|nr:hypothetical protein [Verrucomicrobiales bacterium]MCP5525732.1 hypothetical protein [Verrucomicrobiales bacterium]